MKHMTKLLTLTTAMALSGVASAAASVSGSTNFKVTLPEILVLYHWDEAHLNLTASTDGFVYNDGTPATNQLNKVFGSAGDAIITGTPVDTSSLPNGFGTNKIKVILQDSWAVRSISSGNVTLKLDTRNTGKLTRVGGTESMLIEGAKLKCSTTGTACPTPNATTVTIKNKWTPKTGNIEFNLNLANATAPGVYTSNGAASPATEADDTFLLTLTGN